MAEIEERLAAITDGTEAPETDLEAQLRALGTDEPAAPAEEPQPEAAIEAGEEAEADSEDVPEDEKAASRAFYALRNENRVLRQRMEQIVAHLAAQSEPEPEGDDSSLPDPEEDPVGHLGSRLAAIEEKIMAGQKSEQERILEERRNQVIDFVEKDHAAVAQKVPDIDNAVTFLRERKLGELRLMYPGADDEQLAGALEAEIAKAHVAYAAAGQSYHKALYDHARALGYRSPATENSEKPTSKRVQAVKDRTRKASPVPRSRTANDPESAKALTKGVLGLSDDKFAQVFNERRESGRSLHEIMEEILSERA